MNTPSLPPLGRAVVAGVLFALGFSTVQALEPRTWVIIDGRIIEAELKKVSGAQITLLDKENRQLVLDKSQLSFGDLDYIKENSPEDKSSGFVSTTGAPPPLPNPAKLAKIDPKSFTKAPGLFSINAGEPFQILETPHFKIMYNKPADPGDLAELAERLWLDTAFFHTTFAQKFRQRKMAIFLCPTDASYNYVGEWYADLLTKSGHQEAAIKSKATWQKTAANAANLPRDVAETNGVLDEAPVLRAFKAGTTGAKPEAIRGVWEPFRVHCLAGDLLQAQTGGVTEFGAKGYFTILTGYSYYKEIMLTGKSETNMVSATLSGSGQGSASVNTAGGFKDSRNWPQELKKLIREGKIKPNLETLLNQNSESADEKINVLAYSFARYLESTPDRLMAFNQLIERISTSNQVPDSDGIAKIYGLADGKALEADWIKYITGSEFR